jgi:hypothetical protein
MKTFLYIFEVLCYFWKYNLYSTRNSDLYEYNTRRRKNGFHVQNCNTSTFNKSITNTGIKLYNILPLELRKLVEFNDIKHKFKLFLLYHPFYTLHEFLSEGQE